MFLIIEYWFFILLNIFQVDIVDFNGSFLARVRDLAGANPIILVVTKVDLLPKGTDLNCVGDWVVEATTKKKLNVLSVHLTSSKSLVGVTGVASEIQLEKKVHTFTIINLLAIVNFLILLALLSDVMAQRDPVAAVAQRYKPIQSAVPGTTLGPIQIDAFLGGGNARMASEVEIGDKIKSNGLNGLSIFWGGLVRIDVLKVLPGTRLTFYGPKALQLHMVPTEKAEEFYQKEIGVLLTPPSGKQRADDWRGLETMRQLQINFEDATRPASDVAISGLGWFSVEPICKSLGSSDLNTEEIAKELHFAVHVPKPVEIFVRPPFPVGKAGAESYQYRDLTEMEEAARPKCYH
ncbi:hypothetical protein HS088_TW18G00986 [Tripterygium wilfordii]|uniref:NOA1/YqeH-like C-terminal domain-containing protein n=1 Tax=Tripterygium wilfordii TaxID=458696 RepID=A0A7J7CDW0_TRIWF|nr:hypothetical protein HS088_TW18G00986 [Tripterygium wilfordii]